MNPTNFINALIKKLNHRKIDVDGQGGARLNQCVDWPKFLALALADIRGIRLPLTGWGNAKTWPHTLPKKVREDIWIELPGGGIEYSDCAVWTSISKYGHVATYCGHNNHYFGQNGGGKGNFLHDQLIVARPDRILKLNANDSERQQIIDELPILWNKLNHLTSQHLEVTEPTPATAPVPEQRQPLAFNTEAEAHEALKDFPIGKSGSNYVPNAVSFPESIAKPAVVDTPQTKPVKVKSKKQALGEGGKTAARNFLLPVGVMAFIDHTLALHGIHLSPDGPVHVQLTAIVTGVWAVIQQFVHEFSKGRPQISRLLKLFKSPF